MPSAMPNSAQNKDSDIIPGKGHHHIQLAYTIKNYLSDQDKRENIVWVWPSYGMSGVVPRKCKKVNLVIDDITAAAAVLFDDHAIDNLLTENGLVKKRKVNALHEDLKNIGNELVIAPFKQGYLKDEKWIAEKQREAISRMKLSVMQDNIIQLCSHDNASAILGSNVRTLDALIEDASTAKKTFKKNAEEKTQKNMEEKSIAASYVQSAVRECINDMHNVERFAEALWKKHGVGSEAALVA